MRQVVDNRKTKASFDRAEIWHFWNLLYFDIVQFLGMTNSSLKFEKASTSAFFSNHSLYTRLLLLLVFGSRPGDHTEGTLVGIGDATNMAVIPQGLTNVSALNINAEHIFRQNSDCWP